MLARTPYNRTEVVPEILIVGEEPRRTTLARRVSGLGYRAASCSPGGITKRLESEAAPAAIMVCAMGADAADIIDYPLRAIPNIRWRFLR